MWVKKLNQPLHQISKLLKKILTFNIHDFTIFDSFIIYFFLVCLGTVSRQNLVWIHDHMWVKNLNQPKDQISKQLKKILTFNIHDFTISVLISSYLVCLGTVSRQNLVWIHDHMWVKNLFDLMHGLDGSRTFGKMHIISFLESHPYKQKKKKILTL